HATTKNPVILMRSAGRHGAFERQPARRHLAGTDARPISESAQPHMKRRPMKTRSAYFSEILQLEQDFSIAAVAIAVDYGLAFFIVLSQCPGADALRVAGAKSWAAVRIEHVAGFRFVEDSPNLQAFA